MMRQLWLVSLLGFGLLVSPWCGGSGGLMPGNDAAVDADADVDTSPDSASGDASTDAEPDDAELDDIADSWPGDDADPGDSDAADADEEPTQPPPLRCSGDSHCYHPEPFCYLPDGICYNGEVIRCGADDECPPGWGECLPDGICSG